MGKIVFFVALGIVAVTIIISMIRVAVFEIKLKTLKNKHSKLYTKAHITEDEGKKIIEYEKEGNKKDLDVWLNIYKTDKNSHTKLFNEIYSEIAKAIEGHKKNIGDEILKLSKHYREQEEVLMDKLIEIECGDKPTLYDLGIWSIGIFCFGIFGGSIYFLIKDVF